MMNLAAKGLFSSAPDNKFWQVGLEESEVESDI